MMLRTPRWRVGINQSEPHRERIVVALNEGFELVSTPEALPDVWLIGPGDLDSTGMRPLRQLRRYHPGLPCIVIAAERVSASLVRDWFRSGAADVVALAEIDSGLARSVETVLERAAEERRVLEALVAEREASARAQGLEAALAAARGAYDQTLTALVTALDCRERETACHSQRVAAFAVHLGLVLGLAADDLADLYRGALIHDVGKVGIPDSILLKPGPLTSEEWAVMRGHSELGAEITSGISFLKGAAVVPIAHHESWDGSGYPRGLRAQEIPLPARIFAIADTYDALRSARPYKEAWSHGEAIERIRSIAGVQLDPDLADVFVSIPETTLGRLAAAVEGLETYQDTLLACREVLET
jgi:putative two-component system response regulator